MREAHKIFLKVREDLRMGVQRVRSQPGVGEGVK